MKKIKQNRNNLSILNGEIVLEKKNIFDIFRYHGIFLFSLALLFIVLGISLAIGQYTVPFRDTFRIVFSKIFTMDNNWDNIQESCSHNYVWPKNNCCHYYWSSVSAFGATYQSIFKNPMVSPDLLGVSAGASVGAATAILLSQDSAMIQLSAFAGGLIAVAITVTIPRLIRNQFSVLVLSGIVIGSLMSSIMNIIKFVADTDTR